MTTARTVFAGKIDSILALYIRDINKIPLLSREEETTLAQAAAKGDKKAKDKIVKANLRFVVNVAKKYQNHNVDLVDLISEGNIGLLTAIERFDITKGYHFISYAVWWIRQAILKAICEKSRTIRLPSNRANELVRIERARKMILSNKSEEEEVAEVAQLLNIDAARVREITAIARDMVSLDASVCSNSGGEGTTIGEFIEDKRYETPENSAVYLSMKADIDGVLSTLSKKEAGVLRCRYGLNDKKAMSLREIGDKFHLTKERIRQIEKEAICRLRQPQHLSRLESYVA